MNHDQIIDAFKECGKNNLQQSFNQHFLSGTSMDKSFLDLLLETWYVII
jgi:AAA15 family ATPase/GTPase